jgi:hypothetical protein
MDPAGRRRAPGPEGPHGRVVQAGGFTPGEGETGAGALRQEDSVSFGVMSAVCLAVARGNAGRGETNG